VGREADVAASDVGESRVAGVFAEQAHDNALLCAPSGVLPGGALIRDPRSGLQGHLRADRPAALWDGLENSLSFSW